MKNKKQNFIKSGALLFIFSLFLSLCDPVLAQTEPLEGTTTVEGDASPEAELMAYVAISKASNKIAENICSSLSDGNKVAVYNDDIKKQIIDYQNTVQIMDSIKRRFDAALPKNTFRLANDLQVEAEVLALNTGSGGERVAPVLGEAANIATGLGTINSAIGALLDTVGFFKTNIKEKGFKLSPVAKEQLIPEVVNQLKTRCAGKNVQFYIPKEMPFSLAATGSTLLAKLENLYLQRIKAENFTAKIDGLRAAYNKRLADIDNAKNAVINAKTARNAAIDARDAAAIDPKDAKEWKKAQNQINRADANISLLEAEVAKFQNEATIFRDAFVQMEETKNELLAIIKQFDTVVASLIKTDDKNPTPLLVSLFEAENVVNFALTNGNYMLELASNSAGSTRRIKQNLFLDLFITTGRISYNGVAAIRYTLYQNQAAVEKSCVVKTYVNFRRMSSLNKKKDGALIINDCLTP
ncbi:MAG: hypothetical protein LC768_15720 [Acidobacteria bacterium]|nr:hypothetical protein [Acidobacteriota bacterium]MCA1639748.1 hypothetical protein [Acidobacteriota bacterium]